MDNVLILVDGITYRPVPRNLGLFCSEDSKLLSIRRGFVQPVTKTVNASGYEVINTQGRVEYVHRIMAELYLQNPEGLPQVNHKNSNRSDNRLDNLEWCNQAGNMQHAARSGGMSKYKKPIIGVSIYDGTGLFFDSLMKAERSGFRQSSISMCLAGMQKVHKGYT